MTQAQTRIEFYKALEAIRKGLLAQGYVFHHYSLARGYIRRGEAKICDYSGRFGTGKVLHVDTCFSNCSNSYHEVWYYINPS